MVMMARPYTNVSLLDEISREILTMEARRERFPSTLTNGNGLSEWPAIPMLHGTHMMHEDVEERWLQYPCPPELEMLPIRLPIVIAHIVKESTRLEQYLSPQENPVAHPLEGAQDEDPSQFAGNTAVTEAGQSSDQDKSEECSRETVPVKMSGIGLKRFLFGPRLPKTAECSICFDKLATKQIVSLSCEHKYCGSCLARTALNAMSMGSSFPPRCCMQEIPTKAILRNLSSRQREIYRKRMREYAIAIADRWYCPSPRCSEWIPPKNGRKDSRILKCPHCKVLICTTCREIFHGETECRPDPGLNVLLEKARCEKWQRCQECGAVVEKSGGCQHMTCPCGAQFCYGCGGKYGSCACDPSGAAPRMEFLPRVELGRDGLVDAAAIGTLGQAERGEENDRAREEQIRQEERQQQEECEEETEEEEAQEEARRREARRILSIDERMGVLQDYLSEVDKLQQAILIRRQEEEGLTLLYQQQSDAERFENEQQALLGKQKRSFDSQLQRLMSTQAADMAIQEFALEEEEINLIVRLPRLFKEHSDFEERELAVITRLREVQKFEKAELAEAHMRAIDEMTEKGLLERAALESSIQTKRKTEQRKARAALRSLVQTFVCDRFWFDRAVEKRQEMLQRYRLDLIDSGNDVESLEFVEGDNEDNEELEVTQDSHIVNSENMLDHCSIRLQGR